MIFIYSGAPSPTRKLSLMNINSLTMLEKGCVLVVIFTILLKIVFTIFICRQNAITVSILFLDYDVYFATFQSVII